MAILNYHNLRVAVFETGIGQGKFAEKMGLSRVSYLNRLKGFVSWKETEMEKACEILSELNGRNYTLDELFRE